MLRAVIPQSRAEIMAVRSTKVSAIRGDATKGEIAERDMVVPASSMIQPSHARFVRGSQAASVNMQARFGVLVGSSAMLGFEVSGCKRSD